MHKGIAISVLLAAALAAPRADACCKHKKNTTPAARPVPNSSTSWTIHVLRLETFGVTASTACACGLDFRPGTKITRAFSASLLGANGQRVRTFGTFFNNTNTLTSLKAKVATMDVGLRSFVNPTAAALPVTLAINVSTAAGTTMADMCKEVALLGIAFDEADRTTGKIKNTHFEFVRSHPCPPPNTTCPTLPKGFADQEGRTNHWPGWDIWKSSRATVPFYVPSRADYSYSASDFPWNPANVKVITELDVRQDAGFTLTFFAHTKEAGIWMSVNGFKANQPKFFWAADSTHGTNKVNVVKRKTINFVASPRTTAPNKFDTVFKFDAPYRVPANSKNLIIQYNTYKASRFATTDRWRPDAHSISSGLSRGSSSTFGVGCPTTRTTSHFIAWTNGEITTFIDTGLNNAPVAGWIGTRLATPIQFPGTQCFLYVNPIVILATVSEATGTRGRAFTYYGMIPASIKSLTVSYQFAVVKRGFPINGLVGTSRGRSITIGTGWTDPLVTYGSVYAYGTNLDLGDPDKARVASFLSTTGVIWKVRP